MRRIAFSNEELSRALSDHHDDARTTFLPGHIETVRFSDEGQAELVLATTPGAGDTATEIVVSVTSAAAALIKYCIRQHIPLPRHAQKAIALSGNGVALDLRQSPKRTPHT